LSIFGVNIAFLIFRRRLIKCGLRLLVVGLTFSLLLPIIKFLHLFVSVCDGQIRIFLPSRLITTFGSILRGDVPPPPRCLNDL
jgi:hypothetical protein